VLPRLAYLGMTNVFALLRLLPMSNRDKDAEILALWHQLLVLQRQLGQDGVRFARATGIAGGAAPAPEGRAQAPAPAGSVSPRLRARSSAPPS
jgi:hypothetical protein